MMTAYEIEKCNALGRALPKAWRKLTGPAPGRSPTGTAVMGSG